MNLITIIASFARKVGLKNILAIFCCLLCFLCGYYLCYLRASLHIEEYKATAEQQKNQLLQSVAKTEKETRDKIATIERENFEVQNKLKANYENTIASLRSSYKLSDGVHCNNSGNTNSMPGKTSNTGELRCYTEDELYRKIERSLAITAECDKLANDYNSLLKICKL